MNKTNHIIHFAVDGTAHCLWTEAVPLPQLGRLNVHRASLIEFNNTTQCWEVRLTDNPNVIAYAHSSREICLQWETETIHGQL